MKAPDGGPAFPGAWTNDGDGNATAPDGQLVPPRCTVPVSGMTLRDYFAAKALAGLCANPGGPFQANDRSGWGMVNTTFLQIGADAYALADAVLVARRQS